MSLVAHHVLLGLAVAALLGTGFRLASLATPTGLERALAAVVYSAALAVFVRDALERDRFSSCAARGGAPGPRRASAWA